MSLSELRAWCENYFGRHEIESDPIPRQFDIPWMVMDYSKAKEVWGWEPQTSLEEILAEIAEHAGKNPDWLRISGVF